MEDFKTPTPLVELHEFSPFVQVYLKRDDLIHPLISGNKWRKLKYNIAHIKELSKETIVTKGGPYSNHIAAVATIANLNGLKSLGIIRGEKPKVSGFTLKLAEKMGMELHFVSREDFSKEDFQAKYADEENCYFVVEGGSNQEGVRGCREIVEELQGQTSLDGAIIALSGGTGGTTAGIAQALSPENQIYCFSALKGTWLHGDIEAMAGRKLPNLKVIDAYCQGGYAKTSKELIDFINAFYEQYHIPLDPVYTGKMMLGLKKMLSTPQVENISKVIAIHTGGLQGAFGMVEQGLGIDWVVDEDCVEAQLILQSCTFL